MKAAASKQHQQKQAPFPLQKVDRQQENYRNFEFALQDFDWHLSGFSFENFLIRYWSGDDALRKSRSLSRKRLCLIGAGIANGDKEAQALYTQIRAYRKAVSLVRDAGGITLEILCQINELLTPGHKQAGQLRRKQNYIGKADHPHYICPQANAVPELMADLVDLANDPSRSAIARAITTHSQFLAIHPFLDGNGRTSRALLDGMMSRHSEHYLSLMVYRLHNDRDYITALRQFGTDGCEGFNHPFWMNAFQYCEQLKSIFFEIISEVENHLTQVLGPLEASHPCRHLLQMLWNQPILSLTKLEDWDKSVLQSAVTTLTEAGLLAKRTLKVPRGQVIYDCPLIFKAWTLMDEVVFSHASA